MALLIFEHVSRKDKYCLYDNGRKVCCGELADILIIKRLIKKSRGDFNDSENIHSIGQ